MSSVVYGDDVDTGDEIGPLVRTPDLAQVQEFLQATRGGTGGLGGAGVMNRFVNPDAAGRDGLDSPILPGSMSQAFLTKLLTDWAGTQGRLLTLDVSFRRSIRHGEELKCIGLITDKIENGDTTLVKLDVFVEDSRGDRPTQGVAEVLLPTRP